MLAKIPLTGVNPARARWNASVEIADPQPISFWVEAAGPNLTWNKRQKEGMMRVRCESMPPAEESHYCRHSYHRQKILI